MQVQDSGNNTATRQFTLTVNGSGVVTLDQLRAVVHSPDSGPNQSTSLSAADLITLTGTITDKDGDAATATLNIGQSNRAGIQIDADAIYRNPEGLRQQMSLIQTYDAAQKEGSPNRGRWELPRGMRSLVGGAAAWAALSAVVTLLAPGSGSTRWPAARTAATRRAPGSLMAGVPASLT